MKMYRVYCLISLFIYFLVTDRQCSSLGVSLRFRDAILQNNSYVKFRDISVQNRVFCVTDKTDCCNFVPNSEGDWYLPNGQRIRGGFEFYRPNYFARSRGRQDIGLYRHNSPPERGQFHCELPDYNGNNHSLVVNIVDEIPVITTQPVSQTVLEGKNVTFSTNVLFAEYSTYQWQKNNMYIMEERGHFQGTTTPILIVIGVHVEDEGEYHCVVDNFLVSHTAELSVGEPNFMLLYDYNHFKSDNVIINLKLVIILYTKPCLYLNILHQCNSCMCLH